MGFKYYVAVSGLAALVLTGCVSHPETIEFTDKFQPRTEDRPAASPQEPGLNPAALAQIELDVFSCLLSRHFGDDEHFSAVFIAGDESRTKVLVKKFPQHLPPVKSWWHLDQRPGLSPLDRDTGKAAIVLSVDVADPEGGTVIALGKWNAGPAIAGFYRFAFKNSGEGWVIQSVK